MRSTTSSAGLRSRETFAQSSRLTAASRVESAWSDAPAFSTKTRRTQPPARAGTRCPRPRPRARAPPARARARARRDRCTGREMGRDARHGVGATKRQKKTRAPAWVPRFENPPTGRSKLTPAAALIKSSARINPSGGSECLSEARKDVLLRGRSRLRPGRGRRSGRRAVLLDDDELDAAILRAIARP